MKLGIANRMRAAVAGALFFLVAGAASGEAPPPTLAKVRAVGAIYLAHQEDALPFSYLDDAGEVQGFAWELCQRVVDAVKARLAVPELKTVPVLTGQATRILAVEAGIADLVCGPVVNTDQRARSVAFSNTYFVAGIKALVRKEAGIRAIADLKGRSVVTIAGTSADAYVKAVSVRRNLAIAVRTVRSRADALDELAAGRADAFVADDFALAGLLAGGAADAGKHALVGENFAVEPYGLVLRKGDAEFKKLVDETLVGLMKSGEFERIYAKWFESPLPPQGRSLNLPMSPELKQLIRTPNDRGV